MLYYRQNDQGQAPVDDTQIIWKPHPGPQTDALSEAAFEILYGGARGGGKTDAGMAWLLREAHNPKLRALVIRRNSTDLEDWIDRATLMYAGVGAVKTGNPPRFIFPSGAIIRVGHLKDDAAYTKYIGHEYQRILIEELTLIPSEEDYLKLISSCRSTIDGLESRIFCTTNPTGVGHAWVKKRFVDIAPPSTLYTDPQTGRTRIYIPAKIDDNPTLVNKDPGYVMWLEGLKEKNENLYKAWRYGSWDVFSGQVFSEFRRDLHIIKPFIPKKEFPHFIWIDWGYSGRESHEGAFAAYASALIKATHQGETFNRVITYKEWYGKYKAPDEWAQIIYQDTNGRLFRGGYCDSSMFSTQSSGGISIANLMERKWEELNDKFWIKLTPGTKNRIQRVTTAHNWLQMAPDGLPYWLITENCQNLIRTLPQLVYDEHNPEDVDTSQEDHCYDAATYGLASIKFIPAYLGGIGKPEEKKKALPEPIFALDLSEFEEPIPRQRDWRAI